MVYSSWGKPWGSYGGSHKPWGTYNGNGKHNGNGKAHAYGGLSQNGHSRPNGHGHASSSSSVVASTEGLGAGLQNLGNTCFMNSVLQCLLHTGCVWHYLRATDHSQLSRHRAPAACVACDLEELCAAYAKSKDLKGYVAPRALVKHVLSANNLAFGMMHDSHEFMTQLLDGLLQSNLSGAPKATS